MVAPAKLTPLQEAICYLDGQCDGAQAQDGHGFNGRDTQFGKSLAAQARAKGWWSPRQEAAAHRMVQTYRTQVLAGTGIDVAALPKPEHPEGRPAPLAPASAGAAWASMPVPPAPEPQPPADPSKITARRVLGPGGIIASKLPGYEHRDSQLAGADLVERAIEAGEHAVIEAGTGCIQGEAEIVVNRGGNARRFQLRDLVEKFNGGGGRYTWEPSIPTFVQREDGGVIRLARLLNAWCSGIKQTFTVTTETGRSIRATAQHPFLSARGWLRLDEIQVGDSLHVAGSQAQSGRQSKPRYIDIYGLHAHPYRRQRKNGSAAVEAHRLVAEAMLSGLEYDEYVERVREGDIAGLTFLNPAYVDVHHIDADENNNDPKNLAVLSQHAHHRLHALNGGTANVLFKATTERVISVEPYGEEMTYDLEVADDPHNFLANGFVVHNTGKSLMYLVPAILSGKKVHVSTADKALQQQIIGKDIPFLQSVMPVPFEAALLKGRGNYACKKRLAEIDDEERGAMFEGAAFKTAADAAAYQDLKPWLAETADGDLETAPVFVSPTLAADITVPSDECTGRKCPFHGSCFVEQAKARAKAAQVVVVNHALLLRDTGLRGETDGHVGVLPEAAVCILDEAHHLEEIACDALGGQVTLGRWLRIVKRIDRLTEHHKAARTTPAFRDKANDWMVKASADGAAFEAYLYGLQRRLEAAKVASQKLGDESGAGAEALGRLRELADDLGVGAPEWLEGDEREQWRKLAENLGALCRDLETAITPDPKAGLVRYAQIEGQGDRQKLVIYVKPIDVAPALRDLLFTRHQEQGADGKPVVYGYRTVVATSATLASTDGFAFWRGRVGLDAARELLVASPFDYPRQSLLYLPQDAAAFDPSAKFQEGSVAYTARLTDEIEQLLLASDGRAFVLFTSFKTLRDVHARLAPRLRWTVLVQGEASRPELVRRFKEDGRAVLFGVKSFWEGVDVQGDALSLVIIDKLPFVPPDDPVWEAKCQAITERTGDRWAWFNALAVPNATIALKQGFGRLIRSRADRGVVAILDGRLSTKRYGSEIVRALPPAAVTRSLDAVRAFFAR